MHTFSLPFHILAYSFRVLLFCSLYMEIRQWSRWKSLMINQESIVSYKPYKDWRFRCKRFIVSEQKNSEEKFKEKPKILNGSQSECVPSLNVVLGIMQFWNNAVLSVKLFLRISNLQALIVLRKPQTKAVPLKKILNFKNAAIPKKPGNQFSLFCGWNWIVIYNNIRKIKNIQPAHAVQFFPNAKRGVLPVKFQEP